MGGSLMPVFTRIEDVPERIIYRLLKPELLTANTAIQVLPVQKQLFFYCLPDDGFFVVNNKVIIYETRILKGLTKCTDFSLDRIVKLECDNGAAIKFLLANGEEWYVRVKLPVKELENIIDILEELIQATRTECGNN